MANKHKGEVTLQVGSVAYVMRLSVNALCYLEEATGKPVNQVMSELQNGSDIKLGTLRQIVHASLVEQHKDVDLEKAGDIMEEAGIKVVVDKLTEALLAAFPPEAKAADKDPK